MITSQVSRVQYTGNAVTTIFAYPFLILDQAHLRVIVTTSGVDSVKTLTTDYIVSGVGIVTGGAVAFVSAPAAGTVVTIRRVVPYTQETDYVPNDNFPSETHEKTVDKLTQEVQQLAEQIGRTVQLPETEVSTTNPVLAAKASRTGTIYGFDTSGNPYLFPIDPALLTITPATTINTVNIVDRAVTEPKLAIALDLSAHTVTLPSGSVFGSNLAVFLDMTGSTINLPQGVVLPQDLYAGAVSKDSIHKDLELSTLGVNLNSAGIIVEGSSSASENGTYLPNGYVNGSIKYVNTANNYYIQVATVPTTPAWAMFSAAAVELYRCEHIILGASYTIHATTPDQEPNSFWVIKGGAGPVPTFRFDTGYTPLTASADKVVVNGTVRATAFIGDGSKLTGLPNQALNFTAFPNRNPAHSGSSFGYFNCFVTGEGQVAVSGNSTTVGLFTGIATATVKTAVRPPFRMGTLSGSVIPGTAIPITDNLCGYTDPVVKAITGMSNVFALTASGLVYALGRNDAGQCGQGAAGEVAYFRGVKFGATNVKIVDITCTPAPQNTTNTNLMAMAIDVNGKLWTWGYNGNGQTGTAAGVNLLSPTNVPGWAFNAKKVTQIACIGIESWVLAIDGATTKGFVYGAGANISGSIGDGTTTQRADYTLATGTGTTYNISKIGIGGSYYSITDTSCLFCLDKATGILYATGYNANMSLGVGDAALHSSLTACLGSVPVSNFWIMGGGKAWGLALKSADGKVMTWGRNGFSQLGDGTSTDSSTAISPTTLNAVVGSTLGVFVVDCRSSGTSGDTTTQTMVLLSNGQVWICGYGGQGQLADNTLGTASVFQRWPVNAVITQLYTSGNANGNVHAADTQGRIWGAGPNGNYELLTGNNDATTVAIQGRL